MKIRIQKLHPGAIVPKYATDGAACFDLHACFDTDDYSARIYRNQPKAIPTGLAFEIPHGHVMLVFSRSGHAFKNSTRLGNCVGVIDADYRGEVKVNLTRDDSDLDMLQVRHGDRIAQAMLVPYPRVSFIETEELTSTERGAGGFGSTGK
jgi:dUTP pyrophosphatase